MDPKEQQDRYTEVLAQNTNTLNLLNRIEQNQSKRRFRALIRWWWNKITFRGYKNRVEAERQREQMFRRQIEKKARQFETNGGQASSKKRI